MNKYNPAPNQASTSFFHPLEKSPDDSGSGHKCHVGQHKGIPVTINQNVNVGNSPVNRTPQCSLKDNIISRKTIVPLGTEKTLPPLLESLMIRPENPDHLVKIEVWLPYGDPKIFNEKFSKHVDAQKLNIVQKKISASELINNTIQMRRIIEESRGNKDSSDFELLRNDPKEVLNVMLDITFLFSSYYSSGNKPAVELTHNKYFIKDITKHGNKFLCNLRPSLNKNERENVKYGVIVGQAGDLGEVYLTQIVTSPQVNKVEIDECFGWEDKHYVGEEKRSAVLIHTDPDKLKVGLKHVERLIDQAMAGDLSVIPHIHWWYVQLAPTYRGPGGTVEMIIHALCAARGYYLPGWAKDISPSIKVLVQPDEDAFCQHYHKLFEAHQDSLQMLFRKKASRGAGRYCTTL